MELKSSGLKDIDGKDIYAGMVCEDTLNFSTVFIKEVNGKFYASHFFSLQPLEDMANELRVIK